MKYRYPWKVLRIYAVTCTMYTLAFSAHLTLQKFVFSATVTSVMSNALLTFAEFSSVVHWTLRSPWIRGAIVLVAEVMLVSTVATLPYALSANGGVWTLFVVQSPGVFLAMAIRSQRSLSKKKRVDCTACGHNGGDCPDECLSKKKREAGEKRTSSIVKDEVRMIKDLLEDVEKRSL